MIPDGGIFVDVGMKWQIHPVAKMFPWYLKSGIFRNVVESMSTGSEACSMHRWQSHVHFTINIQRKIADKAYEIAFGEDSHPPVEKIVKMKELLEWRRVLKCKITQPWE